METRSTRMEPGGRCADVITSTCPTDVVGKALVPGCTVVGNEVEMSIEPELVTLWPEVQAAIEGMQALTPLRYTQPEVRDPDFVPDIVQIIRGPSGPRASPVPRSVFVAWPMGSVSAVSSGSIRRHSR